MIVDVSTRLDAPIERVWDELQTTRLLVHVTSPMVRFTPLEPAALPERWSEGRYRVGMKVFGGHRQRRWRRLVARGFDYGA